MATLEQVAELKTKMREQRAELIEAVRALSPADLLRVPMDAQGEEQWTALEQLAHLRAMEQSYDAWVLAAISSENPDLTGIVGESRPGDIPLEAASGQPVEALLRALELQRAYTNGLIDGLPLTAFDRPATSPFFGTLTVLQWLRSFYRHDRQHLAQILGRKSDYQPRFLAGVPEPDQRRSRPAAPARDRVP